MQLKEKGNEFFNEGKYPLALHNYQQSIQILYDIIYYFPDVLREVVLLYGNHSLTLLKLDRLEDALQSANKCIQFDESFPKVCGCVGLSCMARMKHTTAFVVLIYYGGQCKMYKRTVMIAFLKLQIPHTAIIHTAKPCMNNQPPNHGYLNSPDNEEIAV